MYAKLILGTYNRSILLKIWDKSLKTVSIVKFIYDLTYHLSTVPWETDNTEHTINEIKEDILIDLTNDDLFQTLFIVFLSYIEMGQSSSCQHQFSQLVQEQLLYYCN